MLKSIKNYKDLNFFFIVIKEKRYLVLSYKYYTQKVFVQLPSFVSISISIDTITLFFKDSEKSNYSLFISFFRLLSSLINTFKVLTKKTLIIKGLGLKSITGDDSVLKLALGYSHHCFVSIPQDKISVYSYKNYMCIVGYDRALLGNFTEKVYKLKKANPYKGRGLFYKEKPPVLKIIKKTK